MAEHSKTRMFSEIMATGMEKTMDETESDIFSDSRKNLSAVFKKAVASNVDPGEEHMKCYLRVRPFSDSESDRGENQGCLEILDDNTIMTKAPKDSHIYKNHSHGLGKTSHKFTFSRIFDEDTTQKEFFDDTMLNLVRDFIDGQNCLVFTYGVTSSGKTYTIQGKQSDAGILPRALDVLFNSINNKQLSGMNLKPKMFMDVAKLTAEQEEAERKIKDRIMQMSTEDDDKVMMLLGGDASDMSQGNTTTCSEGSNISTVGERESKESLEGDMFADIENRIREETKISVEDQGQIRFSIWCSFAEIYNEQIFDLLEALPKKKNAKRPVLRLSDDKNGSPYIKGLKEVNVLNADEAYKLLNIGQRNLRTACTKLNHNSSRSHCIFNIKIIRVIDNGNPRMARVSMLSLCDLAGSERSSKTLSQGERLKEAGNINTSLMTLGRCIEMLRYNQNHKENGRIIPFRDSKLTRLFQNFFSGRGKAAMIVNVNQCASMFDETLHVFKFSAIAKQLVVHQKPEMKKLKSLSVKHGSRDPSIMWDTPGAMMKYNSQFVDDDEEDEDLDVSISELQEALNLVELLQNQLTEERRSRVLMEAQIREEVCKEMMQQIVSIEENYNEMLRESKQQQEEKLEERVKMLMESIHRPRKRPRGEKSDENTDEWVPSIRLHAEELKVKDLTSKVDSMTKEMVKMKAEVSKLNKSQETRTKTQTSLEFQLADSKSTITELLTLKDQFESRQKEVERENRDGCKTIEDLKQQLQQALAATGSQSDDVGNIVLLETLSQQLQQSKDKIRQQV
ncbi:kinesin-like protein KIF20A, partial [Patella vulgata]|uniref:kinesin-like protein KIF20A n=1 Tax=Patella vulgata TaxID=6465 RepID=UPI0021807DE6